MPSHWHEIATALYGVSHYLVVLVMLVVVPQRRPPDSAKSWLLLVFFLPWVGLLLFLILGRRRLSTARRREHNQFVEELKRATRRFREHPDLSAASVGPEHEPTAALAENLGGLPILGGNAVEWLSDYGDSIGRLVADIDAAGHHVHLLYYIFADDATGLRVVEALRRAVLRGVDCRVLIDAVGSSHWLRRLLRRLGEAGVEAHPVLPVGLFRREASRLDLRNHRKIAVIDGRVGYTGSQNMVDADFKPGIIYKELVVRVAGPVVAELQAVFLGDWYFETGRDLRAAGVIPEPARAGGAPAQVLPSGPDYAMANNKRAFVSLLYNARRRVVVTTPYFIPDEDYLQAMTTAAARGVEVHLVVSARSDQLLVGLAQQSYYEELLDAGVQIHRYLPGLLHAKHMSVDGEVALVGSSNMDIRSFALNAEVTLILYDAESAARLRELEEHEIANAETLTAAQWRRRPLRKVVAQNIARLMSPLL